MGLWNWEYRKPFCRDKIILVQSEQSVYPLLSDFRGTKINSTLVAFLPSWWRWLSTGAKIYQVGNQSNPKHSIWKARNVGHWTEQKSISGLLKFSHVGKACGTLSRRIRRCSFKALQVRLFKTVIGHVARGQGLSTKGDCQNICL